MLVVLFRLGRGVSNAVVLAGTWSGHLPAQSFLVGFAVRGLGTALGYLGPLRRLASRPVVSWRSARWEDNKQPGYADTQLNYYPDEWKVRRLSANDRPNTICVALKPQRYEFAYSFRGEDQLQPGWMSHLRIRAGTYLVRVTVRGKGLERPASKVFELEHGGVGSELHLRDTHLNLEASSPS